MTRIGCLLAGLVLAAPLLASASPPETPAWAAKVDEIFAPYSGKSPGCALAVIRDGEIAYEKGYGLASMEHSVPIAPDTVFDIGSVSKQFAAASVLLLAQDGKLTLDDDVRKWIPELPDYRTKITIRHLFHHTSGLRDYTTLMSLAGARTPDRTTSAEALAMIVRQEGLDFPPGTEESYSNTGYFLLSVIVQRASGKGLNEFSRERIFQPLGMADTHFLDDTRRIVPRKASGYGAGTNGTFRVAGSNWEQIGDGSLLTTVRDLAKWVRNFEDPKVGGPALVAAMEEVGSLSDGTKLEYASGLRVDVWRGLRRVSHSGAWAGYRAALVRFPAERTAFAATCNRLDAAPSSLIARAAEVVLAGRLGPAPPTPAPAAKTSVSTVPATEAERIEGLYFEHPTFAVRRVERKDGGLVYRNGDSTTPLVRKASGVYLLPTGEGSSELHFSPANARATAMEIRWTGEKPRRFHRVNPWSPTAADLSVYAGVYESTEIDAKFVIAHAGGRLVLHRRGEEPTPLEPVFGGAFENEDVGLVVFSLDASGPPPGSLEIDTGGSKIRFLRRAS